MMGVCQSKRSGKSHRVFEASDITAVGSVSESDPARSLIDNIMRVVPVSRWSFAHFKGNGSADQLLTSSDDTKDRNEEFRRIRTEFVLQRRVTARGPRMAATISPLAHPFSSGLAMLFADRRHDFGVLTLLRTDALGGFTSAELRALTLALDASADLLSSFPFARASTRDIAGLHRVEPPVSTVETTLDEQQAPEMFVLDTDLHVVFAWSDGERRASIMPSGPVMEARLPIILEKTVRELISSWASMPGAEEAGVAAPLPFLVVRTQPLRRSNELFIGVLLDRLPSKRPVLRAADRYAFSPKEIQTLALLLDGATLLDICMSMSITSSTAQDHIKALILKTSSRNRSEMIAKVLGWTPTQEQSPKIGFRATLTSGDDS